jgi:transposase-like protein
MSCTKEEIQAAVEQTPLNGKGRKKYSRQLRADVVKYAGEQQRHDKRIQPIADELGIKAWTLTRWLQQERRNLKKPAFIEVEAAQPRPVPSAAIFEVVCPSGYQVKVPGQFDAPALRQLLTALEA